MKLMDVVLGTELTQVQAMLPKGVYLLLEQVLTDGNVETVWICRERGEGDLDSFSVQLCEGNHRAFGPDKWQVELCGDTGHDDEIFALTNKGHGALPLVELVSKIVPLLPQ